MRRGERGRLHLLELPNQLPFAKHRALAGRTCTLVPDCNPHQPRWRGGVGLEQGGLCDALQHEMVGLLERCLDLTKLTPSTPQGCIHGPRGGMRPPYQALFCEQWWSHLLPRKESCLLGCTSALWGSWTQFIFMRLQHSLHSRVLNNALPSNRLVLARALITEYHRLGSLNNRQLWKLQG